jgi:hypothetical protein
MTSDGGSLLLSEPDKRYKVTETITSCLTDYRCPDRITCELLTIVRQRIMSIAWAINKMVSGVPQFMRSPNTQTGNSNTLKLI